MSKELDYKTLTATCGNARIGYCCKELMKANNPEENKVVCHRLVLTDDKTAVKDIVVYLPPEGDYYEPYVKHLEKCPFCNSPPSKIKVEVLNPEFLKFM